MHIELRGGGGRPGGSRECMMSADWAGRGEGVLAGPLRLDLFIRRDDVYYNWSYVQNYEFGEGRIWTQDSGSNVEG